MSETTPYPTLYRLYEGADGLARNRVTALVGRALRKLVVWSLMSRVPRVYPWSFEGVNVQYDTSSRELKWWFSVRHRLGEVHEEPVTRLFLALIEPGDTVIDLGARWGHYSLPAARLVGDAGRVLSVDMDRDALRILDAQIGLNGFANIQTVHRMLGSAPDPTRGVSTLDQTCEEFGLSPDLMKADLEGHEYAALVEGGRQILEKHRPDLLVEVHPQFLRNLGASEEAFLSVLREVGYTIYHVPELRMKHTPTRLVQLDDGGPGIETEYMIYATTDPSGEVVGRFGG